MTLEVEMVLDTSRRGNFPAPPHAFALRLDDELALRLLEPHNVVEHFERVAADSDHLGKWLGWAREPTVESVRERIAGSLRRFELGDGWRTELCLRGEPVGSVWLHGLDDVGGSTEVGYWISARHEGKGLVTRALRALMRHFFEGRGLGRVSVGLDPRNERSMNVVRRLGLEPEAVLRRVHVDVDGATSDLAMFALLREEWDQAGGARDPGEGHGDEGQPKTLPLPRFCLEVDGDDDLYLGLFELSDAEELTALVAANAEHLRPWLPWVDGADSRSQRSFIAERALPAFAAANGFEAGIWSGGRLVGAAGVHDVDRGSRSGLIGFWLDRDEQGKGIVTRVVRAIAERCFSEPLFEAGPFERLELAADVTNIKSRAVAERLGFVFEGVLRRQPFGSGRFVDQAIYGLLRSEWEGLEESISESAREPGVQTEPERPLDAVSRSDLTMEAEVLTKESPMTDEERDKKPTRGSEEALDEALDDTYPASDPPSHGAPDSHERQDEEREEREDELDDALEDTFPASDPVSQTAPHRDDDDETESASGPS